MLKKALLVSMVLVFALVITMSSSVMAQEKYEVAYIARAQGDSFAAWLANSIVNEAENYENINVEVFDGQGSDSKQNSLIENAITNEYDLIIIQPNNGEAQRPYAEQVVEAGIELITTNARIEGIEGGSSVDADPYAQAAVVAERAVEQVPENANVVVLTGPPGNFHSSERRKAWEAEFFEKRPDVTIVGEQIANWNKDEAMRYMEDWVIANDRIDAIISMNDNMAAGALEVVKDDPKFNDILAYGVDGTAEACLLIKDGLMTATTMQSAYALADKLLWASDLLLRDEVIEIHTNIGNPVVDQSNVDKYIEMHEEAGNL
ncbi:monosaccharide ABC transporter substrate-binding protein (CUT2 family) [Halanaerobium saccharolyticum]|uniref:Monosaccharide ABC transporter substrate-binding protein (CUT2 family) n=2 Tax=Halanaerobium saccharolyticum TaxID=43595 RepID=A0A4R6L8M6_9FIRM|nr:sugar ABC transporter substrate-binding protein [Halanaerobium saccharolyticum]TDO70518.1 monosaccharide ABC transporter substrate-binding protein (CUT2 family) [Halanaerobium saccharolyticum]